MAHWDLQAQQFWLLWQSKHICGQVGTGWNTWGCRRDRQRTWRSALIPESGVWWWAPLFLLPSIHRPLKLIFNYFLCVFLACQGISDISSSPAVVHSCPWVQTSLSSWLWLHCGHQHSQDVLNTPHLLQVRDDLL